MRSEVERGKVGAAWRTVRIAVCDRIAAGRETDPRRFPHAGKKPEYAGNSIKLGWKDLAASERRGRVGFDESALYLADGGREKEVGVM